VVRKGLKDAVRWTRVNPLVQNIRREQETKIRRWGGGGQIFSHFSGGNSPQVFFEKRKVERKNTMVGRMKGRGLWGGEILKI